MEEADLKRQESDAWEPTEPFSAIAFCFQSSTQSRFPDEGKFDEQ
jgi:hypothetical protein